jgi:hypothetical protein
MIVRAIIFLMLFLTTTLGCALTPDTATPVATPIVLNSTPDASGWINVAQGIDYRQINVSPTDSNALVMHVVRVNPAFAEFRVHYRPTTPPSALEWWNLLDGAAVFINGNFFDNQNEAVGMLISDGTVYGASYVGFGGMFGMSTAGVPRVQSLVQTEGSTDGLIQAVQGFPMLVEPGGAIAKTGENFDVPARRTAIGQDFSGNILIFSTGLLGEMSLRDLQTWLHDSDLGVAVAFNLDGGKSSSLLVRFDEDDTIFIPSLVSIPVVLAVYPK